MKHIKDQISVNLLKLRENRNLSLDKLAEITGVSKSMLRQIETGRSSPTIATIWKIANGLKVSFTSLLKNSEVKAIVKDFMDNEPLMAKSKHYRLYPLVAFDPQRTFEIYYIEIDPKTTFKGEPHEGDVEEYVFVIRGELKILMDNKEHSIKEGQFLSFQANIPHDYTCIGENTTKAMMLITYL